MIIFFLSKKTAALSYMDLFRDQSDWFNMVYVYVRIDPLCEQNLLTIVWVKTPNER